MGKRESEQVSLSLLQQSPFRTENFYIIGENANTSPSTIPAFTPAHGSGKSWTPETPSVDEFQEQPEEEKLKILRSSGDTRRRRTYVSCGPFNSKNPFCDWRRRSRFSGSISSALQKIIFVFFCASNHVCYKMMEMCTNRWNFEQPNYSCSCRECCCDRRVFVSKFIYELV